jgi:hypothetical protein
LAAIFVKKRLITSALPDKSEYDGKNGESVEEAENDDEEKYFEEGDEDVRLRRRQQNERRKSTLYTIFRCLLSSGKIS